MARGVKGTGRYSKHRNGRGLPRPNTESLLEVARAAQPQVVPDVLTLTPEGIGNMIGSFYATIRERLG